MSRRILLVDKNSQIKILGLSLLISVPIIVIFIVAHVAFVNSLFDYGISMSGEASRDFYDFITLQSVRVKSVLGFSISMILLLNLACFFLMSHAIAGPIAKIKKLLEDKNNGKEVQALEFRNGDFFFEIAPLLNQALGLTKDSNNKSKLE